MAQPDWSQLRTRPSRRLLVASGVAGLVGAAMWGVKSVVILATGDQPDYWFELALVWFGVAVLLLALAVRQHVSRPRLIVILGWVAAVAGGAASVAYWIDGDDEGLFGPASFVSAVATIALLFLVGKDVQHRSLLGRFSFAPRLLGWLYVLGLVVGAILSGVFGERYLEVGLLGVVAGWALVAVGALSPPNAPVAEAAG